MFILGQSSATSVALIQNTLLVYFKLSLSFPGQSLPHPMTGVGSQDLLWWQEVATLLALDLSLTVAQELRDPHDRQKGLILPS